jgi:hypothetical protein
MTTCQEENSDSKQDKFRGFNNKEGKGLESRDNHTA